MWKSIFLIVASIKYVNAASQFKPRKKYITNCFNQDLIYSSPNPNPTKQPKPKLPISPHVGSAVPEMAPLHTVWPCLAHWEEFMIKLLARLTESAVMGGACSGPLRKPQGQSQSHHVAYELGSYWPCMKDSTSGALLRGQVAEVPCHDALLLWENAETGTSPKWVVEVSVFQGMQLSL